ncbi:MAG: hypothetical protein M3O36_09035 [Myxococcota bacterium]|nr:hypothetical protein [Myxococcota bacterium]
MSRSWSLVVTFVTPVALAFAAACSSDSSTTAGGSAEAGTDAAADEGGSSGRPSGSDATAAPDATAADSGKGAVSPKFSFFVTSKGGTAGGNLGGLSGADSRCQAAAAAVGAGSKTWHAYLSVSAVADGGGAINARDRIGTGPWYNVRGALIAANVAALHEEGDAGMNGITAATGLDENGDAIPAGDADAGIAPQHDILTGSSADGRAYPPVPDYTCAAWTSSQAGAAIVVTVPTDASLQDAADAAGEAAADAALADAGADANATSSPAARVGHVNRVGSSVCPFCAPDASIAPASWNSAHPTPGCAQTDLVSVGGTGRLYCFAID